MRTFFCVIAALSVACFTACGGDSGTDAGGIDAGGIDGGGLDAGGTDAGPSDAGPGDAGPTGPTIAVTCTGPTGGNITATITVTNFVIETAAGQPAMDGHGHIHAYLDDSTAGAYLVLI